MTSFISKINIIKEDLIKSLGNIETLENVKKFSEKFRKSVTELKLEYIKELEKYSESAKNKATKKYGDLTKQKLKVAKEVINYLDNVKDFEEELKKIQISSNKTPELQKQIEELKKQIEQYKQNPSQGQEKKVNRQIEKIKPEIKGNLGGKINLGMSRQNVERKAKILGSGAMAAGRGASKAYSYLFTTNKKKKLLNLIKETKPGNYSNNLTRLITNSSNYEKTLKEVLPVIKNLKKNTVFKGVLENKDFFDKLKILFKKEDRLSKQILREMIKNESQFSSTLDTDIKSDIETANFRDYKNIEFRIIKSKVYHYINKSNIRENDKKNILKSVTSAPDEKTLKMILIKSFSKILTNPFNSFNTMFKKINVGEVSNIPIELGNSDLQSLLNLISKGDIENLCKIDKNKYKKFESQIQSMIGKILGTKLNSFTNKEELTKLLSCSYITEEQRKKLQNIINRKPQPEPQPESQPKSQSESQSKSQSEPKPRLQKRTLRQNFNPEEINKIKKLFRSQQSFKSFESYINSILNKEITNKNLMTFRTYNEQLIGYFKNEYLPSLVNKLNVNVKNKLIQKLTDVNVKNKKGLVKLSDIHDEIQVALSENVIKKAKKSDFDQSGAQQIAQRMGFISKTTPAPGNGNKKRQNAAQQIQAAYRGFEQRKKIFSNLITTKEELEKLKKLKSEQVNSNKVAQLEANKAELVKRIEELSRQLKKFQSGSEIIAAEADIAREEKKKLYSQKLKTSNETTINNNYNTLFKNKNISQTNKEKLLSQFKKRWVEFKKERYKNISKAMSILKNEKTVEEMRNELRKFFNKPQILLIYNTIPGLTEERGNFNTNLLNAETEFKTINERGNIDKTIEKVKLFMNGLRSDINIYFMGPSGSGKTTFFKKFNNFTNRNLNNQDVFVYRPEFKLAQSGGANVFLQIKDNKDIEKIKYSEFLEKYTAPTPFNPNSSRAHMYIEADDKKIFDLAGTEDPKRVIELMTFEGVFNYIKFNPAYDYLKGQYFNKNKSIELIAEKVGISIQIDNKFNFDIYLLCIILFIIGKKENNIMSVKQIQRTQKTSTNVTILFDQAIKHIENGMMRTPKQYTNQPIIYTTWHQIINFDNCPIISIKDGYKDKKITIVRYLYDILKRFFEGIYINRTLFELSYTFNGDYTKNTKDIFQEKINKSERYNILPMYETQNHMNIVISYNNNTTYKAIKDNYDKAIAKPSEIGKMIVPISKQIDPIYVSNFTKKTYEDNKAQLIIGVVNKNHTDNGMRSQQVAAVNYLKSLSSV